MRAIATLLLIGACAGASEARADVTQDCVDAYDQTQALRKSGRLVDARERAVACSQSTCPKVVSKDCSQWLAEIEVSMPTAVFSAELDGVDTSAVRVRLDGKPLAERLDGKAVSIDPGEHAVRFEVADADAIEQTVVIAQGQKNRTIRVSFKRRSAPLGPAPSGSSSSSSAIQPSTTAEGAGGVPAWAWVVGGIGVATSGVGLGLLVASVVGQADITDHCGKLPAESGYDVDQCQALGSANDVKQGLAAGFGGAGVVAIAVAIIGIATAPPEIPQASVRAMPWIGRGAGGLILGGYF